MRANTIAQAAKKQRAARGLGVTGHDDPALLCHYLQPLVIACALVAEHFVVQHHANSGGLDQRLESPAA